MAQKKITDLQLLGSITGTENVPVDDTLQTYRTTLTAIKNWMMPDGFLTRAKMAVGAVGRLSLPGTKTTTYSISATDDDLILCSASGGAFTVTLPTAASVSGRIFRVMKTDSSVNKIQIASTSSQTINGVNPASVAIKLCTQYEMLAFCSDGSNWVVVDHRYNSQWVSFSPSGSWNTNVGYSGFKRRVGDTEEVEIRVQLSGAPNATGLTLTLPSTIDTNKITTADSSKTLGPIYFTDASAGYWIGVARYNSTTAVEPLGVNVTASNSADSMVGINATTPITWTTNDRIVAQLKYPVVDWYG